jgi:hypothetical protein
MGTSAETAIVLFADQGKQTSFFCLSFSKKRKFAVSIFRLQQTNGSCPFSFRQCRLIAVKTYIPVDSIVTGTCLNIKASIFHNL